MTSSPSPPASNRFETLSSLPSESDIHSASGIDCTEANETHHEHSESFSEHAKDDGIEDDAFVQDSELHFALWVCPTLQKAITFGLNRLQDLETTCAKVKTYWAQAALGKMSVMLAGFLTNAAIANVASRFRFRGRFFDMSTMISYEKTVKWLKSSTLDIPQASGPSGTAVTNAFINEMQAPFTAIILCQQGYNGNTLQAPQIMIGKPQDYITPLEGPLDSIGRFSAEGKVFESLLMSIKQLPCSRPNDAYDLVMGFHPFIPTPDLNTYVGPIPTSATYVLRLIVESYKSWYVLPTGEQIVPKSNLRLHSLRFAQDVHKSIVRFRLSEPYEPIPGCDCSDCCHLGLMELLGMFESDLSIFMRERRFDLYHQSPVVAGYQMTRILARATLIGTLFCNIWQYVGVVLHLYNLLRQYDLVKEESILLEHLCNVMGHTIFRGPRPTLNFFSQYAAFQAMTYKFDQKSRKFAFGESKTCIRQFGPHNLSVMAGLNDCGCRAFCHRWGLVWRGIDRRSRVTNDGIKRTAEQIASHPLVCVLEPLESIVRSEWEGNFPVARINWFEVFSACTDILEKMSSVHCQDPRDLMSTYLHLTRDHGFSCGKDDVESLLAKAQQLDRQAFKIICATDITPAVNAIRETFKSKTASVNDCDVSTTKMRADKKSADFLWDL